MESNLNDKNRSGVVRVGTGAGGRLEGMKYRMAGSREVAALIGIVGLHCLFAMLLHQPETYRPSCLDKVPQQNLTVFLF